MLTISIFEHDSDIFEHRGSVRVVIDKQQGSHLGVKEPTVLNPHISKSKPKVDGHAAIHNFMETQPSACLLSTYRL